MADKKVFTLEIDGVKQSYDEVVKLHDILNKIKDVHAKVTVETEKATKATESSAKVSKEKTKALTDEEKAQKKLADTQAKASKPISDLEKEQAKANLQLKERARQLAILAQLELAAKNSPAEIKAELAKLNSEWNNVEMGTEAFEDLTVRIGALNAKLKDSEFAKGTFGRNVGNYPKQIEEVNSSFEKLGDGVHKTTEDAKGLVSAFQAGVGIALIFDDQNSDLSNTMNSVGKTLAIVGALQQANNTLIKSGTASQIVYNLQSKARAGLDILVTKGIITQTTAQTALNIATKAFPLLLIIGGLVTLVSLLSDVSTKTETFTSALDGMSFSTQAAADKHDEFIRRIRDIQIEIDVANGKITEYQANLLKLANKTTDAIDEAKKNLINSLSEIDKEYDTWYKKLGKSFTYYITGQDDKASLAALEKERLDRRNKQVEDSTSEMVDIYRVGYKETAKEDAENNKKKREEAKSQSQKLADLIKERNKIELELTRQAEDSKTDLIVNEFDRREEQVKTKYSRQREDLQKRLDEDKNLTKSAREAIDSLIAYSSESEISELKKVSEERAKDNEDKINKQRETWEKIRQLNKDSADKESDEISRASEKELLNLTKQLEAKAITQADFDSAMRSLNIASLEKEISIRKKYGQDTTSLEIELSERRIDQAEYEKNKVVEHFKQLHETLQKYVDGVMTSVSAIFDATNSILQSQLDEANEKYDAISKKYDEVVEKREESDDKLQELEEQAKNARGGRALVLQEQINAEMVANQQLANQEKQLAKEKEKQENEIAKKEKQMKRVELTQNIVQGIANTALGVTKALEWGFPLGPVFAAIVGAMGAVQVGVMSSQLAKLEDGGLLKGKRHSQGGMRVEGTNIEVEGGEYVVNRESTNKNIGLVKYINSQRRTLGPNDLSSFFSKSAQSFEPPFKKMFADGGRLPAIENTVSIDNDALVDAIQGIKIEPKVSVVDINKAQNNLVNIDDIVGM